MRKGGEKMAEEEKELCESLEISLERLTIKSQALKWYFLNKVQKCILDIFWTKLEFLEPWKLHDKKSIVIGAQKGVLN